MKTRGKCAPSTCITHGLKDLHHCLGDPFHCIFIAQVIHRVVDEVEGLDYWGRYTVYVYIYNVLYAYVYILYVRKPNWNIFKMKIDCSIECKCTLNRIIQPHIYFCTVVCWVISRLILLYFSVIFQCFGCGYTFWWFCARFLEYTYFLTLHTVIKKIVIKREVTIRYFCFWITDS